MDDRRTLFTFTAELWEWKSRASWYFLSIPEDLSAEISDQPRPPRGFGSIKVRATVGGSVWTTSIFPQTIPVADNRYMLPLKKAVRDAEGVSVTDRVLVQLELLE